MKLVLKTNVASSIEQVWQKFDRDLFLRLAPPFPRVKLNRFDGCQVGDLVEVQLNFGLFKQIWTSEIIDQRTEADEISFTDCGMQLPFFLKSWVHRHRLIRNGSGCTIVDDIEYRSPGLVMDWLLWPGMWLQFAYRKPIYRRTFAR